MSGVRRHDLDWLRVTGVLTVFVFHSMHFFDLEDWSVKNAVTYGWVGSVMSFLVLWMMPLIFIVSGASIFYASRKGSAGAFAKDKVLRLLVPLLVGVFTFSVGQVYLERLQKGQFHGSLLQFLPHYFEGLYFPGGTGNFAFHGMHLWYLMMLFIFTIALIPLFWWLRGDAGTRALRRVGDLLAVPGLILLLAVPTVVLQNVTEAGILGGQFGLGGWRPVQYLWFLLAGYLIISHEKLQERIVKARWISLAVAVVMIAMPIAQGEQVNVHPDLAVWPCLFALLGFGMKHLTSSNRFLAYANEAVLPFYILHQNVLLWLGFFVVGWTVPDLVKYPLIMLPSFATIVLAYEYLVRRNDVLRVLFGMKPRRRAVPAGAAA